MSRPSFAQGVLVAAAIGVAGAAFAAVFVPLVGAGLVARLLIAGLSFAYIVYLLSRAPERCGRVTVVVVWLATALLAGWLGAPLAVYVLVHATAIWLVRALYFYSGVLPALADAALTACGIVVAVWALSRTGSVFIGTWAFFLVQALFVVIPASLGRQGTLRPADAPDDFERARRRAEAALRQLIN